MQKKEKKCIKTRERERDADRHSDKKKNQRSAKKEVVFPEKKNIRHMSDSYLIIIRLVEFFKNQAKGSNSTNQIYKFVRAEEKIEINLCKQDTHA